MEIKYKCKCGKIYILKANFIGKYFTCSKCCHRSIIENENIFQEINDNNNENIFQEINDNNNFSRPYMRRKNQEKEIKEYKLDKTSLKIMSICFAVSIFIMLLTLTRNFFLNLPAIVLHCFSTLCHEIGHSVFAWIFGYPSIPAFDFRYGGGVAMIFDRKNAILFFIYVMFVAGIFLFRKNKLTLITIISILIIHLIFAFTKMHEVLILFMGHGGELIFATLFLYRAWTGKSTFHEQERILYGISGFFFIIKNMSFSYNLYSSEYARTLYGMAKGGGHWMDFDRIAREYLYINLSSVAFMFFLICFIPIIISFLLYQYRDIIEQFFSELLRLE